MQRALAAAALCGLAGNAQAAPSFDCRAAHNFAERTICTDADLASRDRDLAAIFANTRYQAGIDARDLQRAETAWRVGTRDRCKTAPCIRQAYIDRRAALLDQSLRAASRAAYEETRPYPAPPGLWAQVRGLVGRQCAEAAGPIPPPEGFQPIPTFQPLIANGHLVQVFTKDGARFAFLCAAGPTLAPSCRILDVVTVPAAGQADVFLQCSIEGMQSQGFGLRSHAARDLVAYWGVLADGHMERVALGVLGNQSDFHCHPPRVCRLTT